MKFFLVAIFAYVLGTFTLVKSASVDRYESEQPMQTTAIHLQQSSEVLNAKGSLVDRKNVVHQQDEEEDYYYGEDEEDDYQLSEDFEMPRVAFSHKPKDQVTVINTERHEDNERNGRREKKKGKGKKRNPCLKKYKDFCIHGSCQYLRKIGPSCICNPGYSGERCQFFSLPVWTPGEGYNRTTALAVVAVVLSSLCLTIIGLLLSLRFYKRGTYEVKHEEKFKLGATAHC